jgi:hypothetical protein
MLLFYRKVLPVPISIGDNNGATLNAWAAIHMSLPGSRILQKQHRLNTGKYPRRTPISYCETFLAVLKYAELV